MKLGVGIREKDRQAGLTLMELLMCAGIGVLLVASGSYLFIGQVKGYKDLGTQARLQGITKKAVQSMNTEIANTGASLSNRKHKFIMLSNKLQFAYVDLKSRHCAATDTVTLAYFAVSGGSKGDTLISQITCNSRKPLRYSLIKGQGLISLGFTYYDINGATTLTAAKVKSVEFNLDVKSMKGKSLFVRDRNPKIRVELLN